MTQTKPPKPDNYQVWAVLSTFFCCLPIGILSLMKSNQVDTLWASGNYDEAIKASEDVKKYLLIALICAAIGIIAGLLLFVILIFA